VSVVFPEREIEVPQVHNIAPAIAPEKSFSRAGCRVVSTDVDANRGFVTAEPTSQIDPVRSLSEMLVRQSDDSSMVLVTVGFGAGKTNTYENSIDAG
jgi:hypothetical protein